MMIESSWNYYTSEAEFVKYFERLKEIGMSFNEIETKLPQLEKYYFEMVVDGVFYHDQPTIKNLFIRWKAHR